MKRRLINRNRFMFCLLSFFLFEGVVASIAFVIIRSAFLNGADPVYLFVIALIVLFIVSVFPWWYIKKALRYRGYMQTKDNQITIKYGKVFSFSPDAINHVWFENDPVRIYRMDSSLLMKIKLNGDKDYLPVVITDKKTMDYFVTTLKCSVSPKDFPF